MAWVLAVLFVLYKKHCFCHGPAQSALVSMSTNRSQPCHVPRQSSHAKCEHKGTRNDRNLSDCSLLLAPLLRNEKIGRARGGDIVRYVVLSYVPRGLRGCTFLQCHFSYPAFQATTSPNLPKGGGLHFFILYHLTLPCSLLACLLQMHSCIRVNERKGEWYGAYGRDWD